MIMRPPEESVFDVLFALTGADGTATCLPYKSEGSCNASIDGESVLSVHLWMRKVFVLLLMRTGWDFCVFYHLLSLT